jgi:hypothetical protein
VEKSRRQSPAQTIIVYNAVLMLVVVDRKMFLRYDSNINRKQTIYRSKSG